MWSDSLSLSHPLLGTAGSVARTPGAGCCKNRYPQLFANNSYSVATEQQLGAPCFGTPTRSHTPSNTRSYTSCCAEVRMPMPLPTFRSGVTLGGTPRFYPVRDDRGRVVGYAQGAGGQARRDHNPGQALPAARPSATGGPRVRPSPVPPPARAARPVSYLEAARAPLGIARAARPAPPVVRWGDLRAIAAAGRATPQPVEKRQLEREYVPRQRAINISTSCSGNILAKASSPPACSPALLHGKAEQAQERCELSMMASCRGLTRSRARTRLS